jgi:hypothetical protein
MIEFSLSQHAQDRIEQRQVSIEWIARVLESPRLSVPDRYDAELQHYLAPIPEFDDRVLRVIVNVHVEPIRVVTFFFDRSMRGKL